MNTLLESLYGAKDAVRDLALSHLLNLIEGVQSAISNRLTLAQSVFPFFLIIIYLVFCYVLSIIIVYQYTNRNNTKES